MAKHGVCTNFAVQQILVAEHIQDLQKRKEEEYPEDSTVLLSPPIKIMSKMRRRFSQHCCSTEHIQDVQKRKEEEYPADSTVLLSPPIKIMSKMRRRFSQHCCSNNQQSLSPAPSLGTPSTSPDDDRSLFISNTRSKLNLHGRNSVSQRSLSPAPSLETSSTISDDDMSILISNAGSTAIQQDRKCHTQRSKSCHPQQYLNSRPSLGLGATSTILDDKRPPFISNMRSKLSQQGRNNISQRALNSRPSLGLGTISTITDDERSLIKAFRRRSNENLQKLVRQSQIDTVVTDHQSSKQPDHQTALGKTIHCMVGRSTNNYHQRNRSVDALGKTINSLVERSTNNKHFKRHSRSGPTEYSKQRRRCSVTMDDLHSALF